LFIFIKALIAKAPVCLYHGIYNYWHLPHMSNNRETSKLVGGFTDHAADMVKGKTGEAVNESNKYSSVGNVTKSTVQDKFYDLFDWTILNNYLNPLRPDVLNYIEANYKLTGEGYTQQLANFRLFKEKNIRALADAIQGDEYDDDAQYQTKVDNFDPAMIEFVRRNARFPMIECGAGSGLLTSQGIVADVFIEPCKSMLKRLSSRIAALKGADFFTVIQGVIECIPEDLPMYGKYESVVFLNGLFQVRSIGEALIEVNNALAIGGTFVFNLYPDDNVDIICGHVFGPNNFLRVAKEFGFDTQEFRPEEGLIAIRKVRNFDLRELRKLQIIPRKDGTFDVKNLLAETRDSKFI
jgi:hypothetical protein